MYFKPKRNLKEIICVLSVKAILKKDYNKLQHHKTLCIHWVV
jgi:hypothetical protein